MRHFGPVQSSGMKSNEFAEVIIGIDRKTLTVEEVWRTTSGELTRAHSRGGEKIRIVPPTLSAQIAAGLLFNIDCMFSIKPEDILSSSTKRRIDELKTTAHEMRRRRDGL